VSVSVMHGVSILFLALGSIRTWMLFQRLQARVEELELERVKK
jgi:hypothetical protein